MNRRNIIKSIPAIITSVAGGKLVEACSSCEQGRVRTACGDLIQTVQVLKSKGKGVHLLLRHKDILINRRHISTFDLKLKDFKVDQTVFDLVDVIQFHSQCGQFRLFKMRGKDTSGNTYSLLDVWNEVSQFPIVTTDV